MTCREGPNPFRQTNQLESSNFFPPSAEARVRATFRDCRAFSCGAICSRYAHTSSRVWTISLSLFVSSGRALLARLGLTSTAGVSLFTLDNAHFGQNGQTVHRIFGGPEAVCDHRKYPRNNSALPTLSKDLLDRLEFGL